MDIVRVILFGFFLPLLVLVGCTSPSVRPTRPETSREVKVRQLVIEPEKDKPALEVADPFEEVLDHKYFKIVYDTRTRLAKYVTYELKAEQLRTAKKAKRRDKFRPDPLLVQRNLPYVEPSEYTRSGYDKGHLAPAADFAWSQEAQDLTFVMSNLVPQKPRLNQDAWRRLEAKVRRWACGEEHITVVTGPVLGHDTKKLPKLKSGLPVPQQFFKIVIDETPPRKIVAFVYNQTDKGDVIAERKVEVGALSKINGVHVPNGLLNRPGLRAPASLEEWKEKDCR